MLTIGEAGWVAVLARLAIRAEPSASHGGFEIGGPEGTVLRPVAFGERTAIVRRAAEEAVLAPADAVAARILTAATVRAGLGDRFVLELAALALAGADDVGPPFDETARLLEAAGWTAERIAATAAADVDRVGAATDGPPDGWTRLVFTEGQPDTTNFEALRTTWAGHLLARLEPADRPTAAEGRLRREQDVPMDVARPPVDPGRGGGPPRADAPRLSRATGAVTPAIEAVPSGPVVAAPLQSGLVGSPPGHGAFAFRMHLRAAPAEVHALGPTVRGAATAKNGSIAPGGGARVSPLELATSPDGHAWVSPFAVTAEPASARDGFAVAAGGARALPIAPVLVDHPVAQADVTRERPPASRAAWDGGSTDGPVHPASAATQRPPRAVDPVEMADRIAMLLDDESDLRGIAR